MTIGIKPVHIDVMSLTEIPVIEHFNYEHMTILAVSGV